MNIPTRNRDIEIGKRLAALREEAKIKQNELAKKLTWSAAQLSRIENGERGLAPEELQTVLAGIATPNALKLQTVLEREWEMISEPPLDDQDSDLLWEAEVMTQEVHKLSEQPDVRQFYERRLLRYKEELMETAASLADKRYRAAFIGTIAVGKSTAICRAEGLEIPTSNGMPKSVLETGAGGITICEVHIRRGPGYGLIVEPCTEDEVRRHVSDFAHFLMATLQGSPADSGDGEGGTLPGVSREVERALRNMTRLRRRRTIKRPDGTVTPAADDARDLAARFADAKSLSVELLSRMEMHKRDRRDIWHNESTGIPPLKWLQETFEHINNGRSDEFTLPRRIEVVVPDAILGEERVSVTMVDTQGIDDIAGRRDLEDHFYDTHTVVVLCTTFNEAPATPVRQLLVRAREGAVRTLDSHFVILALPRPGDALAVKDNGDPVQTAEEGYEIKGEEVQLILQPMGLENLPTLFFNAAEDPPENLRSFILARIYAIQDWQRNQLRALIDEARTMLKNYETDQARQALILASNRITVWLDHNPTPSATVRRVHDSLVTAVGAAHPRTVLASVRRDGDWWNLNYAHHLSHGARRLAAGMTEPLLNEFFAITKNLLQDSELSDAHDLIEQTVRLMQAGVDAVVRKAQLVGQSIHSDDMVDDSEFWANCVKEWGNGNGFRNRVNIINQQWFETKADDEPDERVIEVVSDNWSAICDSVRDLLVSDDDPTQT